MSRNCGTLMVAAALTLGMAVASAASSRGNARRTADAPPATARDAMRILRNECLSCHNDEKQKGGLVLSSRARLLQGGDEGAVVVPGKPEASRLLTMLGADADPHMPPRKQLSAAQINSIRGWLKAGALWDETAFNAENDIAPVTLSSLPASYQPALALALSPDGRRLAVGRAGRIVIHDTSQTNFPFLKEIDAHIDAVQSLAWSRDGRSLASSAFRRVAIWDGETGETKGVITNGLLSRVTALQFAPDRPVIACADGEIGSGGFIRFIDVAENKLINSVRVHDDAVLGLDISRDGSRLVTAGADRLIKVWQLPGMKEIARLEGHAAPVMGVAFNTNATLVVSGGIDKVLKVWDIATKEKIMTLGRHKAGLASVAWPGDGAMIIAADDAGMVFTYRKLKAHTGEQSSDSGDERKIGKGGDSIVSLAVNADGTRIFTGHHGGALQVWNNEGRLLATFEPPAIMPGAVEVSPATPASKAEPILAAETSAGANPAVAKVAASLTPLALVATPSELRLRLGRDEHQLLIAGRTADGFEVDVTSRVKFTSTPGAPFELLKSGRIRSLHSGTGAVTAKFKGRQVVVPVQVEADPAFVPSATPEVQPRVSFLRDVLPVLSKAGCNAGACHAKGDGQNGFKLSVFSYDPKGDFAEIVKEARGRRVFPSAPDESLLIKKPLAAVPHEGGERFRRGSEAHLLLAQWLREGMAYTLTNEPALERIRVFPSERRYRKGALQPLLVQAHYSDGSIRDVTRLAAFDANDREIASVDKEGLVRVGSLTGQGVVVARYMGFVDAAHILVPADRLLPEAKYAALPRNNFIDDLAYAQFQRIGLFPSELSRDTEFLRRAKLDAIGTLPTAQEVVDFVANQDPAKRQNFIRKALSDPAYGDHWANKWADLLRPNPDRVGVKSVFTLDQWLRESFRNNKRYNEFVREILLAEGSNHRDGPAVVYRDRREPAEITTMFSQLFLGTRLECARCHHHPNEKWAQEDFYQFAAFFGSVKQKGAGLSPPISAGTETFYFSPGGKVTHPVTEAVMTPRPPDGPQLAADTAGDPRVALADWLTAPTNAFFAPAIVNRVWAQFFGRGLVEPVDDFRISNPCSHPALLSALAADFVEHGYDLKQLMSRIMESRLYQLSSDPTDFNRADTKNFSRAYRRRLPAEVLLDAVIEVTGIPDTFAATPVGTKANQAWSYKIDSHFLDAFGRPNASSDCPCERDTHMSVVQSLHLMNARGLQSKLGNSEGRVHRLAVSDKTPADIINELYLSTLSRPPTDEELFLALSAYEGEGVTRQSATEDVLWALLNCAEFVFNH